MLTKIEEAREAAVRLGTKLKDYGNIAIEFFQVIQKYDAAYAEANGIPIKVDESKIGMIDNWND